MLEAIIVMMKAGRQGGKEKEADKKERQALEHGPMYNNPREIVKHSQKN